MRKHPAGFSLVELLIVIAIIALLIGMLLPAIGRVRRIGRSAVCLSNLQQLGAAYKMYLNANANHSLPNTSTVTQLTWWEALNSYCPGIKRILLCPEATEPGNAIGGAFRAWGPNATFDVGAPTWKVRDTFTGSYAINAWLLEPTADEKNDLSQWWKSQSMTPNARGSERIPVFGDCIMAWGTPTDSDTPPVDLINPLPFRTGLENPPPAGPKGSMAYFCLDRHFGAVNIVFLDGHAENVGLAELWKLKWNNIFKPRDVTLP
jgi:prepilin-type N-terminal cleavage/methylation domain-containing protein/prepilin-type processing-associated H-X9-DG protein